MQNGLHAVNSTITDPDSYGQMLEQQAVHALKLGS